MKKSVLSGLVLALAVSFLSCESLQMSTYNKFSSVKTTRKPKDVFSNLDKGIEVQVISKTPQELVTENNLYHLSGKNFFIAPTIQYVRSMGLEEMKASLDYKLFVNIDRADLRLLGTLFDPVWIDLSVSLIDENGNEVFSQKSISTTAKGKVWPNYTSKALDEAYTQALEQINWNRIASFLRTEQSPKEEPQKQVQGYGDTALENTIIRWDVQSRPQGADIFWRVASTTPEVKSTNNKYLQTTPYEATKALDIRGLSYQTAGNVRIILRCEKEGYLSQEKEYDVRMVLDQEEISAFFRLVKEE